MASILCDEEEQEEEYHFSAKGDNDSNEFLGDRLMNIGNTNKKSDDMNELMLSYESHMAVSENIDEEGITNIQAYRKSLVITDMGLRLTTLDNASVDSGKRLEIKYMLEEKVENVQKDLQESERKRK